MGIQVRRVACEKGRYPLWHQLWEATFSREAVPVSEPCPTPEDLAIWMTAKLSRPYGDNLAAVLRGWMPSLPGAIDKEANP